MKNTFASLALYILLLMATTGHAEENKAPATPPEPTQASSVGNIGAVRDLQEWVDMKYRDPSGRPLPVTGNWMCGLPKPSKLPGHSPLGWDPNYFVELIKQGHHVIPTFSDTIFLTTRAYCAPDPGNNGGMTQAKKQIDELLAQWRPALEFCRDHKLPITFRGFNMLIYPVDLAQRRAQITKEPIKPEIDLRLLQEGKVDEKLATMDPFGPIEGWREFGAFWFNNPMMNEIQKIYPDPPLVIFLDNNEAGKAPFQALNEKADRFVEKYGAGPHDEEFRRKALAEGYAERLAAMFDAGRKACVSPTWRKNLIFVAYNNYVPPHDGGILEFYDNDFQPTKTDFGPAGLQSDAMNRFAFQDRIFDKNPGFYWSTVIWDGEFMSNIWRSRGKNVSAPAKPFQYASSGQRWDFNRYEGTFQFGLWVMRPKEFREFRGNEERNAYMDGAWQRALAMVDRPWNDPVLRDFWRFGTLVPNRFAPPTRLTKKSLDAETEMMDRWFLLNCSANPPRGEWVSEDKLRADPLPEAPPEYEAGQDPWKDAILRVFSIALVRGEKPDRRWLIYAHAPLGAVANANVQLPGFGDVNLESVPLSGSFFLVTESDRSVKTLLAGGPAEIAVTTGQKYIQPGAEVTITAEVTSPPADPFTGFTWSWGDGKELKQGKLDPVKISFAHAGDYLVTVVGSTKSGQRVVGQQEIFVGDKPDDAVLYDLPLSRIFEWNGPWRWAGQYAEILTNYSQLPNAGSKGRALVAGGKIVTDPERGEVLEFSGNPQLNEGIWLALDKETVMDPKGVSSRTISMWFKAVSTQPRQILYADGSYGRGTNIYLFEGKVYAGSWADVDWPGGGNWLSTGEVQPGKWYHVSLVLDGAKSKVEDGKMSLYLDGVLAAKGPARRIPASYCPPRVGGMTYTIFENALTSFHDKWNQRSAPCDFNGRLSDFQFINRAVIPSVPKQKSK